MEQRRTVEIKQQTLPGLVLMIQCRNEVHICWNDFYMARELEKCKAGPILWFPIAIWSGPGLFLKYCAVNQ